MKTCLLLANGPSLNDIPASFVSKYPNCGLNKIFMKKDYPVLDRLVVINPSVIVQNATEIQKYAAKEKFIRADMAHWFTNAIPLVSDYSKDIYFSSLPMEKIHEGFTVTFVALQILAWQGFTTILIAGLDHYYQQEGAPNSQQLMTGADPNHFDPEYFKGQRWELADIANTTRAYQVARQYADEHGIRIVNISTTTALSATIFERDDWHNW